MKIIGVIPARHASTRFPGKPLADICGKPMIWWVYQQLKSVTELSDIYVATDDERINETCKKMNIKCVMTAPTHSSVFDRIQEFSDIISADYYIVINGDEPLINPDDIRKIIPDQILEENVILNTISKMNIPAEVNDISNIKVIFDHKNNALYMSRTPIPFPNKRIDFDYYKHVGITCINKQMLDFYSSHTKGNLESIEGIDHLRFIDYGKKLKFVKLNQTQTLSVDTPKDLEKVRKIISEKIAAGEIAL